MVVNDITSLRKKEIELINYNITLEEYALHWKNNIIYVHLVSSNF